MALLYFDGYDNQLGTADNVAKGVDAFGISPTSDLAYTSYTTGVYAGSCLRFYSAAAPLTHKVVLASNYTTLIVGFHFNCDGTLYILKLMDGTTVQVGLYYDSSAKTLAVYNGDGLLLGTHPFLIVDSSAWHYVEFKVTINNGAGSYTLVVDGVSQTVGGLDTQKTANSYVNAVWLTHTQPRTIRFDNLIVMDDSGGTFDDIMGEQRTILLSPAAGSNAEWTPTGAANNYQCVDDSPYNSDTDYVTTNTVDAVDTYNFADQVAGTNILAVVATLVLRHDDAGAHTVKHLCIHDAAEHEGGNTENTGASYHAFGQGWLLDPDGDPWDLTNFNAAEFGFILKS